MKEAKFAMALHCYQPVFNLDEEIEAAYNNSYSPVINTLKDFPRIRVSLHISGNMIEWFEKRHPEYIKTVRDMVGTGQIELIGGGCFEPVMPVIPEHDREEQIKMNEDLVKRVFGVATRGAWIAERVWDPELITTLSRAGKRYTIVDDYHITRTGIDAGNVFKPYITRDGEDEVILFPGSTRLRYAIPFMSPRSTFNYFREVLDRKEEGSCFFFADDIEKFGAWPYTYRHVHSRGWLRDFLELLERNSPWLGSVTYSEMADTVKPCEIDTVPSSSYMEMMKWSDGDFRNFFRKYPESGRMYKRMVSLSEKIKSLPEGSYTDEVCSARRELFKAQSNCAYWHGIFGGVYLPHLRAGVYRHLINAQDIIDNIRKKHASVRALEYDINGRDNEIVINNSKYDLFLRPGEGGIVSEIDHRPLKVNLVNTISRRREGYHKKLGRNYFSRIREARRALMRGEIADIHDILGVAERGLKKVLCYDSYRRKSFITHIFPGDKNWKEHREGTPGIESFLTGNYSHKLEVSKDSITSRMTKRGVVPAELSGNTELEVEKAVTLSDGDKIDFFHKVSSLSGKGTELRYALEFNFLVWDKSASLKPRIMKNSGFSLEDRYSGLTIDLSLDREYTVITNPMYTVNETERGLKKIFQGISVLIGSDLVGNGAGGTDFMKISVKVR